MKVTVEMDLDELGEFIQYRKSSDIFQIRERQLKRNMGNMAKRALEAIEEVGYDQERARPIYDLTSQPDAAALIAAAWDVLPVED